MALLNFVLPKVLENKLDLQWKVLTLFSLCLRHVSSLSDLCLVCLFSVIFSQNGRLEKTTVTGKLVVRRFCQRQGVARFIFDYFS